MTTRATSTRPDAKAAPSAAETEPSPSRIVIQYPSPTIDGGRFAVKRCVGDSVTVSADVFRDGHEIIRAVVRFRGPGDSRWRDAELKRTDAHLDLSLIHISEPT